jgi:hypothetical protein
MLESQQLAALKVVIALLVELTVQNRQDSPEDIKHLGE